MAAAVVLALLAGAAWHGRSPTSDEPLALFTTLPIYWGEAPDIAGTLKGADRPHWARAAIESQRPLRPIDALEAATLRGTRDVLIVQPRPLSPAENVALDDWVSEGGHLLLFADPALTETSAFPIGDRRRPQNTVLLSPILARWGLALSFNEGQAVGEHAVALGGGTALAINLAGRFRPSPGGRPDASCQIATDELIADCRIGRGRVVAIADAALFERSESIPAPASRRAALKALLERAFLRSIADLRG